MSSMKFKCQHHATMELSLVCIVCNNKPICDLCKLLHHKGHTVRAIASGPTQEQRELDRQIQKAKGNLERHRQRLSDFERSVSLAEDLLTKRGQVLTTWVQEYVKKKISLVQLIAEEGGRRDIAVDIREAEKVLKGLEARAALMSAGNPGRRESLGTEPPASLLEDDLPAMENEIRDSSKYAPHIFIPDSYLVQWKPCVEEFISNPLGAQTSEVSRKSDLAVVLKLTCSTNPKARVLGLRVVGDEDVIVILTTDDPNKALLKIISKDMNKVYAEEIGVTYPCKIFLSAGKLLLVSALTGAISEIDSGAVSRFLSQYTQIADCVEDCVLTFKKRLPRKNAKDKKKAPAGKHQKLRKIYEVIDDVSRPAFSVHAQNPRTPVSDASGKFIAIIQDAEAGSSISEASRGGSVLSSDSADQIMERLESRVNSEEDSGDDLLLSSYEVSDGAFPSVSVYRVPEPGPKVGSKGPEPLEFVCRPSARGSLKARDSQQLSDACFCRLGLKQELGLVVADPDHDALLVARRLSEGGGGEHGGGEVESADKGPMLSPLVADCSLLEGPTVLTADLRGRLWIGCQGGKILMLVPKEEVSEGYINYCIRQLEQSENTSGTPARASDGDGAYASLRKYKPKPKPREEPAPREDRPKPEPESASPAQCQYENFHPQDRAPVHARRTGEDAPPSGQRSGNPPTYAVPLRASGGGAKPEARKVQGYESMRLIHPVLRPTSGRPSDGAGLTSTPAEPAESLPAQDVAGDSPSFTPSATVQCLPAKPGDETPGDRAAEPLAAISRNKFSRINQRAAARLSRLSTSSLPASTSFTSSSLTSSSSSSTFSLGAAKTPLALKSVADEGKASSAARRSTSESDTYVVPMAARQISSNGAQS